MDSLIGLWLFASLIYGGQPMPAPNPNLIMTFEFRGDGTSTLRYYRLEEEGFCERRATYEFNNGSLNQEVVWLHPDNAIWCDNDPDMRLGMKGTNPAEISSDGNLHLELSMGEENLVLVWEKQNQLDP